MHRGTRTPWGVGARARYILCAVSPAVQYIIHHSPRIDIFAVWSAIRPAAAIHSISTCPGGHYAPRAAIGGAPLATPAGRSRSHAFRSIRKNRHPRSPTYAREAQDTVGEFENGRASLPPRHSDGRVVLLSAGDRLTNSPTVSQQSRYRPCAFRYPSRHPGHPTGVGRCVHVTSGRRRRRDGMNAEWPQRAHPCKWVRLAILVCT
jgi:hypothetical protein